MTVEIKTFPFPEHGFTCFHCGEVFLTFKSAKLHFGSYPNADPGCIVKLNARDNELLWLVREQNAEISSYRENDQPIMRELYALGAKHTSELMAAEERGYERGLKDGQTYLATQPLPPEIVKEVEDELRTGATERGLARRLGISHAKIRGVARRMKQHQDCYKFQPKAGKK